MSTITLTPTRADSIIDQATASSAHARLNIPLNLDNWKSLDADTQADLTWYHQHCLDERLSLKEAGQAIQYDESTVFRVLKGIYTGNWNNIRKGIASYRRIVTERGTIQQNEFSETPVTRLMCAALDYAMANNSITLVVGESRMGKTVTAKYWKEKNNHGRSVYVIAPAYGGTKALLSDIAMAVGVNKNLNMVQTHQAVLRAFNKNRILIVDEAHRLLPGDRRMNPVNLEILRDIHDRTGAAVALIATQRFDTELKKSEYMFEQLLGRIGMPVRLPRKLSESAIEPILKQYFVRPTNKVTETALQVANEMGRLGILVETLKVASRIATKSGDRLREEHFFKALALRKQMMGEVVYSAK
jgi:DNA transposition AAA+ family ATPase